MKDYMVFISYSHADEWLKNELIVHLAALKRKNIVSVWHDRLIPAGKILDNEIDVKLQAADLFIMLISSDFINSEYCFSVEYKRMLDRHARGEVTIVPVVVRPCDWDVGGLKSFAALPPDAIPVTRGAGSRTDSQQRDNAWLAVVEGLKVVIAEQKKRLEPPRLSEAYLEKLFLVDFIKHPSIAPFDEELILIDPDIYFENKKEQISKFQRLVDVCLEESAVLITGADRSGKTTTCKRLQALLDAAGTPAVKISGRDIRNPDIVRVIRSAIRGQYGLTEFPLSKFRVIIDDFDECQLRDALKEEIINTICGHTEGCILISFSNAPTVLFTSSALPDPATMVLNPITDAKMYELVSKWKMIGVVDDVSPDELILPTFEKIQLIFSQTELAKYPYNIVTFLELLDSSTASDLAFSSFAACYDTLISTRLIHAGINWNSHDESKNFLSLVAYHCYNSGDAASIDEETFSSCLKLFEEQFLSSADTLRTVSKHFLHMTNGEYKFYEEYLWFFLCARYVVKVLKQNDQEKYVQFVTKCTTNIFLKKYANIVIYIAYFSNDVIVLLSLLSILDSLFSKAEGWVLSDDSRDLILGIMAKEQLTIQPNADVSENRATLLQGKIADILNNAEKVVASYTLPFLKAEIGDSAHVEDMDRTKIDSDSYMQSVNALLRIHSVIGQILGARSGTYGANLVLDCITRMVKASGRYVALNHAIATVLILEKDQSIADIAKIARGDSQSEKDYYDKVVRIFSFWSVYLSHAGLARYLSKEHSIRALERLAQKYDTEENKTVSGNIPFNFSVVLLTAQLYHSGNIDKATIESVIKKYGENSAIVALLRFVIYIYSYYMPLSIEDKQWVSSKLQIPLKKMELLHLKSLPRQSKLDPSGRR
jgi:hypothetical protein